MNNLPLAGAGDPAEKAKLRLLIQNRGLVGAANNTKWNELIMFMRQREGGRPSYRYKWIDGFISAWDVEWYYHLPFPFLGVEWLDIDLHRPATRDQTIANETKDYSSWILGKLAEIGFEVEVTNDLVRIFGYLPKSLEDLPPALQTPA